MQLDQALVSRKSHPEWVFITMLGIIAGTSCLANFISLIWIYRNMEFGHKQIGEFVCVTLHLLQLGPLWRYFKLLIVDDPRDIKEMSVMRILHTSLQDAPFIVLQGYLILTYGYDTPQSLVTIGVSLLSLTYSYTCVGCYQKEDHTMVRTLKAPAIIMQFLWHLFMLVSRLICFAVFTTVGIIWLAILLSSHLLCHYIAGFVKLAVFEARKTIDCKDTLPVLLYGFSDIYELSRTNIIPCGVIGNYVFITMENVLMMAIWFMAADKTSLNISLLGVTGGSFLLGIIMCILYHKMTVDIVCCSAIVCPVRKEKDKECRSVVEDIESISEETTGYENAGFDAVSVDEQQTQTQVTHANQSETVDVIDIVIGSDSGISISKPQLSPASVSISHTEASCKDAQTNSDSGCHSSNLENSNSSWSHTSPSRNGTNKSGVNADIQKLCEDIRKECESLASTKVKTVNNTWDLDFELDIEYFGDRKEISEIGDIGDHSSSGCYGDVSTIYSVSEMTIDADIMKAQLPITSTPSTETTVRSTALNETKMNVNKKTTIRPDSVLTSGSYSSSYEDTCTTCRDSYLHHLGDWCTVTTSTSWDSFDDLDSDFDYMTWPPRNVSFVNLGNLPREKLTVQENVARWMERVTDEHVDQDVTPKKENTPVGICTNLVKYVESDTTETVKRVEGRQAGRLKEKRPILMGTNMFQRPKPTIPSNNSKCNNRSRGSTRSLFVKLCSAQPVKRKRQKRKVILFKPTEIDTKSPMSVESMV